MKNKTLIMAAVMLTTAGLMSGCGILPKEEEFQAAPVVKEYEGANYGKTAVKRGDLVDADDINVTYYGTLVTNLSHADEVKIEKVFVKKGERVEEGDVLIRYYIGGSQAQLEKAKYDISVKELELKQQKELMQLEIEKQKAVGGGSKAIQLVREQYDASIRQCETELKILRLEKEEAEESIKEYDLTAPVDGKITYLEPNMEGKTGNMEDTVIKITGTAKNRFEATTKYAEKFKDGDVVKVTVGLTQYDMKVKKPGKKNKIYFYPVSDKVKFDNGTRGEAQYIISQKKDILYLPSSTVYTMGDKKIVYVEDENGMKQIKEVQTGIEVDHLTEIIAGVSEGEEVITN